MDTYVIRAKVLIEIETDFDDTEEPTAETIKFCVDQDIGDGLPIAGAINDCKVIGFKVVGQK